MDQPGERRSRRQLLFGGLAAAAGLALGRLGQPERAAAANGEPVLQGQLNEATAETTLSSTAGAFVFSGQGTTTTGGLRGHSASAVGVRGHSDSSYGVEGESDAGSGIVGRAANTSGAGVIGVNGTSAAEPDADYDTGVAGFGRSGTTISSGVWGDSTSGTGIYGSGPTGVVGDASADGGWGVYGTGGIGVTGDVAVGGTGVYGFVGNVNAPVPTANVAVEARAATTSLLALNVVGKAKFSRSGRTLMGSGTSSKTINLSGVTSSSLVFANLYSYRSGTYVVAVTPTTGSFTIRLNRALASSAYVVWFVLN